MQKQENVKKINCHTLHGVKNLRILNQNLDFRGLM